MAAVRHGDHVQGLREVLVHKLLHVGRRLHLGQQHVGLLGVCRARARLPGLQDADLTDGIHS
eukprot:4785052-Heterocapsa_arctica.AAC.1